MKTFYFSCLYKNVPFTDEEWARRNAAHAKIREANPQAPQKYIDRWKETLTRPVHPFIWGAVFSEEALAIQHCEEALTRLKAQQIEYFSSREDIYKALTRYGWRNKKRRPL